MSHKLWLMLNSFGRAIKFSQWESSFLLPHTIERSRPVQRAMESIALLEFPNLAPLFCFLFKKKIIFYCFYLSSHFNFCSLSSPGLSSDSPSFPTTKKKPEIGRTQSRLNQSLIVCNLKTTNHVDNYRRPQAPSVPSTVSKINLKYFPDTRAAYPKASLESRFVLLN